jgi:hypothetical protein
MRPARTASIDPPTGLVLAYPHSQHPEFISSLKEQTLSIKTRKDTLCPVAPLTETNIPLSACEQGLW